MKTKIDYMLDTFINEDALRGNDEIINIQTRAFVVM